MPEELRQVPLFANLSDEQLQALTQQRDRLAALGQLSAGLAHELNNPAAAAQRAASAPLTVELDPLAQSDHEEELITWLDDHAVADSCDLAPSLVRAALDPARLDELAARLPAAALCDALAWLGASLESAELVSTIEQSVTRLSDLVTAIKAYS